MQTSYTETDKCACCGCDTGIPKDTPISNRKYYIEGCGQLCSNCYFELYIKKANDKKVMTPKEIDKLMRMCKDSDNL